MKNFEIWIDESGRFEEVYFGSFKIPVMIHMISNILAYSLSYLPASFAGLVNWPVCIVCLAVAVICLWLLHRKKRI